MLLGCLWTTWCSQTNAGMQKAVSMVMRLSSWQPPLPHLPSFSTIWSLDRISGRAGIDIQQAYCGFSKCGYRVSISCGWVSPAPIWRWSQIHQDPTKQSHTWNHSINSILFNISVYEQTLLYSRGQQLQPKGQIHPATCVCKWSFIGRQPHLVVCILSMTAFMFQWQRQAVDRSGRDSMVHKPRNIFFLSGKSFVSSCPRGCGVKI